MSTDAFNPSAAKAYAGVFSVADSYAFTSDSTYDYHGFAPPGTATSAASWRVLRYNRSTRRLQHADGNTIADNIFDNATSLSYS